MFTTPDTLIATFSRKYFWKPTSHFGKGRFGHTTPKYMVAHFLIWNWEDIIPQFDIHFCINVHISVLRHRRNLCFDYVVYNSMIYVLTKNKCINPLFQSVEVKMCIWDLIHFLKYHSIFYFQMLKYFDLMHSLLQSDNTMW